MTHKLAVLLVGVALGWADQILTAQEWQQAEGYRWKPLSVRAPASSVVGFSRLPASTTGIHFSNHLSLATIATNRLLEIGSGVALGDVDGDGRVDIYLGRMDGDNALYRNLGEFRFEQITGPAGVACPGQWSTGVALADTDGDGDLDILVNSLGGGTRAFLNNGKGRFSEQTDGGLSRQAGATSLALADVDRDGDLDLYVTHYRTDTMHDFPPGFRLQTRSLPNGDKIAEPADRLMTIKAPNGSPAVVERGEADTFYINLGSGRFSPVRWEAGAFADEEGKVLIAPPRDWGLAAIFRDLNGDGLPDLYVCNDFIPFPDRIWFNQAQAGTYFRAAPRTAFRCTSLASMAVDVADINRDGWDDIFVAEMLSRDRAHRAKQRPDTLAGVVRWPGENPSFRPEIPRNTLHLARGDGTFSEIAQFAGLAATDWTWAVGFLDVDLDGWEDLLLATGALHDIQDSDGQAAIMQLGPARTPGERLRNLHQLPPRLRPSLAFRNRHDLTFEDRSAAWGFDAVGSANGMAFGDLDDDGDLDVVMNCLNEAVRIMRNESSGQRVAVRVRGAGPNTRGVGARITVTGGPVMQSQEIMAGGRYASSDDPMRVFAAGDASSLRIEVKWPSGRRSVVPRIAPNTLVEIDEAKTPVQPAVPKEAQAEPNSLFRDLTDRLNHRHQDRLFDDFARHPLLYRKLSDVGPGVAWTDVEGDGDDDLVVGGGSGGRGVILENLGQGKFQEWPKSLFPKTNQVDQTGVVAGRIAGRHVVLVGACQWEPGSTRAAAFSLVGLDTLPDVRTLPSPPSVAESSTGPLALADVDGDGNLELFVGGRLSSSRPGNPATSRLLRPVNGEWRELQTFERLGLVNGAVFTDLDLDGDSDLAIACEWGPIRVFVNNAGRLEEATERLGLARYKGFWNGIATGDFNGDGRPDLAVSNWGRNWRNDSLQFLNLPIRMYRGEWSGSGTFQSFVASPDPLDGAWKPWRERRAVGQMIPATLERAASYALFGKASVEDLVGDAVGRSEILDASTFDSALFLNQSTSFEFRPLPSHAQLAPAFGVGVADFDGDEKEDLFLAQNFFGVDPESSRCDAGVGLVLLGDGSGGFRPLSTKESGVRIYGEQRGCAVADFDGDGRPDLAVGQNRGATRLFQNVLGKPGFRVRFKGSGDNPTGIGVSVRARSADRLGPVREVQGGAGYLSQPSAAFTYSALPQSLEVRWPGSAARQWLWPAPAREVEVDRNGIRPLP